MAQWWASVLEQHDVHTVIHFAAHTIVPESVSDPLKYYGNNTCQTRGLLATCLRHGVRTFVFSSTAAVYGIPANGLASEDDATAPINPYGTSKLMSEWMLRDPAAASGAALRRAALLQCRGLRSAGTHRPVHAQGHAAGQGGRRGQRRQA